MTSYTVSIITLCIAMGITFSMWKRDFYAGMFISLVIMLIGVSVEMIKG